MELVKLPRTGRCTYATRASVRITTCGEGAAQNENDAATVITVISASIITELTSILFALKRHISNPSSTGVPKIWQSGWHERGLEPGLFTPTAWRPLTRAAAL